MGYHSLKEIKERRACVWNNNNKKKITLLLKQKLNIRRRSASEMELST